MNPGPELKLTLEALMLMLTLGVFALAIAVAAIAVVGFRRYYRERWTFEGDWDVSTHSNQAEPLVTKMKVGSTDNTVSVFETDGKSHVLIEGDVSDREKKRLLRYLKAEGFI